MSNFRKLDILSLSEVEREVDTLIEIIGDRVPDNEEIKQVSDLITLAKSLGTKRVWWHDTPEWGAPPDVVAVSVYGARSRSPDRYHSVTKK